MSDTTNNTWDMSVCPEHTKRPAGARSVAIAGFAFHNRDWVHAVSVTSNGHEAVVVPGSITKFPVVSVSDRGLDGFLLVESVMGPIIARYIDITNAIAAAICTFPAGVHSDLTIRRIEEVVSMAEWTTRRITHATAMKYARSADRSQILRPWMPALGAAVAVLTKAHHATRQAM